MIQIKDTLKGNCVYMSNKVKTSQKKSYNTIPFVKNVESNFSLLVLKIDKNSGYVLNFLMLLFSR